MKETIKKSFLWGVVFLLTVIVWWYVYAATVWTVTWWQTLTAQMWNDMAGNYDYSTSEVDTGKKWIDGKPIYRKVFSFTANWVGIWKYETIGSKAVIEKIIDFRVSMKRSDSDAYYNSGYMTWGAANYYHSYIKADTWNYEVAYIWSNTAFSNCPVTFIIEYTKTAD